MANLRKTIPASETRSLRAIAREEGINYSTFITRLARGCSYYEALGKAAVSKERKGKRMGPRTTYEWEGAKRTAHAICKLEGVAYHRVCSSLKEGLPIDQAVEQARGAKKSSPRVEIPKGFTLRGIVEASGFTTKVVHLHLVDYALTPEEIIYLGTCPISKYLPKGVTLASLAKKNGRNKKSLEREIRTGRIEVESLNA